MWGRKGGRDGGREAFVAGGVPALVGFLVWRFGLQTCVSLPAVLAHSDPVRSIQTNRYPFPILPTAALTKPTASLSSPNHRPILQDPLGGE